MIVAKFGNFKFAIPSKEQEKPVFEMKINDSFIGDSKSNGNFGQIIKLYKDGIGVSTGDGEIVLTVIKPFGKKKMDVKSYLNGIDKESLIGKVFE